MMAAKNKQSATAGKTPRSFKRSGEGFTPLNENEEITGKFVRMRNITITDRLTHDKKTIRAYDLEAENGEAFCISGRALLDDAFNDVFESVPKEKLAGQTITIKRGEDVDTPTEGNRMGTYEILLWE
jgi:hypothetical protein